MCIGEGDRRRVYRGGGQEARVYIGEGDRRRVYI